MKKILVTTSWDDGHILDLKLASLLKKYSLAGTFYISPADHEIPFEQRLRKDQIVELSKDFEIGAHTMTHPRLSKIDDAEAKEEIAFSKKNLEDTIGREISSFCYPGGDYEDKHKLMVKEAGFALGRTVDRFATSVGSDPFALPTTIHAYRHWSDVSPIFSNSHNGKFLKYYFNWDGLAIDLFNRAKTEKGVFHIWGHSWEIEKNNDWERLENVFKYIANDSDATYVTNRSLI